MHELKLSLFFQLFFWNLKTIIGGKSYVYICSGEKNGPMLAMSCESNFFNLSVSLGTAVEVADRTTGAATTAGK